MPPNVDLLNASVELPCVLAALLLHECAIVKSHPGYCIGLKGKPTGGPEACSGLLKPCLLLNHTDVLGLLWF